MKLDNIRAAEARLLVQTYERTPVLFVRGEGVHLYDENGAAYLDFLSGIGVNALGYAHPAVTATIAAQSQKLLHTCNLFYHEGQAELALRLTEISGMDRAFFCNSGTEAQEAAMKIARAHAGVLRAEGKQIGTKILAFEDGFHGRTMGAVSTTHKAKYREPFAPLIPGVEFVRFNDAADFRAKFSSEVCAVVIETLQGEGGIHLATPEFLATVRELTQQTGALLIADEIQCGLGRTGQWFGYQHSGVLPDVVTLAKHLGGGLPIGAVLCTDEAARAITPGMHGTTFGGGPLACAVACTVVDTLRQQNLLEHVRTVGGYFQNKLRTLAQKHSCITAVRGLGLMLGAELASADLAKQVAAQMLERRILINRTSETVLRFLPPYVIERLHVDQVVEALDTVLAAAAVAGAKHA
jgi:acetylornithine aminotransferase/acetylornithine/N-succinyldiaminopimelate aminotransferase